MIRWWLTALDVALVVALVVWWADVRVRGDESTVIPGAVGGVLALGTVLAWGYGS